MLLSKGSYFKKSSLYVDVFVSKKKRHVQIAFKIPISECNSFDKLIEFISNEWEKRKIFFSDYRMIYPRLTSSVKWKFDYIFFEKKKKRKNNVLEKMCDKIVDVLHEAFTKKHYFVQNSQSKKK